MAIGVENIDALFADIKPEHRPKSFDLAPGLSEYEVMRRVTALSLKNNVHVTPFIGGGLLRSLYPDGGASPDFPRGILHRVYAVSAGMRPGDLAGSLRVSIFDLRPHRYGGFQCFFVRRGYCSLRSHDDGDPYHRTA